MTGLKVRRVLEFILPLILIALVIGEWIGLISGVGLTLSWLANFAVVGLVMLDTFVALLLSCALLSFALEGPHDN